MRPLDEKARTEDGGLALRRITRVLLTMAIAAVLLLGAHLATDPGEGDNTPGPVAGGVADSSTTSTVATVAPSDAPRQPPTTSESPPDVSEAPEPQDRYEVALTEVSPAVKQLAADVAYVLTTYEADDDHLARFGALSSRGGADALAFAARPLTYEGSWSRGDVIYPQLGGLTQERASVMVVIRQTVGSGPEADFSVLRTLDIRLVKDDSGWVFDHLSSAGGDFANAQEAELAQEIVTDPRIDMPDTARLDILSGLVSPTLLSVMADLADQTPYAVAVLATGHPHNVFETERVSHHTIGRAVDIYRVGSNAVIEDRGPKSTTHAVSEWLYEHPDVLQVGSPWDLDGEESRRSFTNQVHQDHIHLAVNE